jgi:hypothetical protein
MKKENELPTPSSTRKLRRRSKSANNLMDPYKNVKSTISTHMQQFRTPQAPRSRLPVKANTAVRPKQKKESTLRPKRVLSAVNESQEEQKLMESFEFEDVYGGPTSIKSAPNNFAISEQPASYEDFGARLKKNNRSSAIGVIQLTGIGSYDI